MVAGLYTKLQRYHGNKKHFLQKDANYIDLKGECHSSRELILDDCLYLRESRGVLPNLDNFSAKNCTSLTSTCIGMLLNQVPLLIPILFYFNNYVDIIVHNFMSV